MEIYRSIAYLSILAALGGAIAGNGHAEHLMLATEIERTATVSRPELDFCDEGSAWKLTDGASTNHEYAISGYYR